MGAFLFVVIPIVIELVYVIRSLIQHSFQLGPLIIFIFYLISVFNAWEDGLDFFKKKIKVIVFLILFPAISILILTKPFNPIDKLTENLNLKDWYDTKYTEKKSYGNVYIYNESPNEVIRLFYSEMTEKPDSFIDKYVDSRWGIDISKRSIIKIQKNEVGQIKIRPGIYKLSLETENIKTGEQFYVDLNTKDTNLKNITDNFFVFDGNNFFRIALWESRDAELINNLKSGTYTEPIVISKGESASNKRQKRIEKYE